MSQPSADAVTFDYAASSNDADSSRHLPAVLIVVRIAAVAILLAIVLLIGLPTYRRSWPLKLDLLFVIFWIFYPLMAATVGWVLFRMRRPALLTDNGRRVRNECVIAFLTAIAIYVGSVVTRFYGIGAPAGSWPKVIGNASFAAVEKFAFILLVPLALARPGRAFARRLCLFTAATLLVAVGAELRIASWMWFSSQQDGLFLNLYWTIIALGRDRYLYREPTLWMSVAAALLLVSLWRTNSKIVRPAGMIGFIGGALSIAAACRLNLSTAHYYSPNEARVLQLTSALFQSLPFAPLVLLAALSTRRRFFAGASL